MRDIVVLGMLVLGFAGFVTTHLVLATALTLKRPRWHGVVSLVVPPLAALWGWKKGRRVTVMLWAGSLVVYAIGRAIAGLSSPS